MADEKIIINMTDEEKAKEFAQMKEYLGKNSFKQSNFYGIMMRFVKRPTSIFGFVVLAFFIFCAIAAPMLAPYSPKTVNPFNSTAGISAQHIFGCDFYGRDILSRLLYGARYSLGLAFSATFMSLAIGMVLGAISGFFGGFADICIQRLCDIIQSIPNILLCIVISQVLGQGFLPTCFALSIGGIVGNTRLLRAQIMSVREQEFVEAAQAINCSKMRIIVKHLIVNCLSPLIINMTSSFGGRIMQSASLSFIGLGIQEPTAEWGAMLAGGREYFRTAPHIVLIPGAVICLVVYSFNLIGDGLRDALDPKLKT